MIFRILGFLDFILSTPALSLSYNEVKFYIIYVSMRFNQLAYICSLNKNLLKTLRLGTRGSRLALWQANKVIRSKAKDSLQKK